MNKSSSFFMIPGMPKFLIGQRVCLHKPTALLHMIEGIIVEVTPPRESEGDEFEYVIDFELAIAVFAEGDLALSNQTVVN